MRFCMYKVLRLCRRQNIFHNKRFNGTSATNNNENVQKSSSNKDFKYLLEKYKHKIVFSSYLEHEKVALGYYKYYLKTMKKAKKEQLTHFNEKSLPPLPVALQYFVDKERLLKEIEEEESREAEKAFQLPFTSKIKVEINDSEISQNPKEKSNKEMEPKSEFDRSDVKEWMTHYEQYDDRKVQTAEEYDDELEYEWTKCYGTPDPNAGVTNIPCGGCGALLHCSDPAIPGYLPSEILKDRNSEELKTVECQRCHFLKEYNIALDVSVEPEEYEKLLQSIQKVKSLVVLLVDLLDFPCSIWPGIVDIIGKERPIMIVANKVDLLPGDSVGYTNRIKQCLMTEISKTKLGEANIKYLGLISAKTGYGVEDLISAMFKYWLYKGDVFLVGCTNVGKSSLFNALLRSDYCKVHAVDIVKRATVSRWPGTTLNLLKFPINRPSGWKISERNKRLKSVAKVLDFEKKIRNNQLHDIKIDESPSLIGHIGRTFSNPDLFDERGNPLDRKIMVLNERDKLFVNSKWFYDTPGIIHPDQVLSLLTTEELLVTIPKNVIKPQTYYLKKGHTIFIGGLARLDFIHCDYPCRFTIFCSEALPITVTKTEEADEVYTKFVGTELFAAPLGGAERLTNWPGLVKHSEVFKFPGEGPKYCCGDVVLSSIGWVSLTVKGGSTCTVLAWTPEGRGIHWRYPSILPYAINLKGKRVRDTPAYMVGNVFSDE